VKRVDVAIIGAGSAGLRARACGGCRCDGGVDRIGRRWNDRARVGCMPSKLLIAAADVAHDVAGAGRFGIRVEGVRIDGRAVMERVRCERDRFVGFVLHDVEALPAEQRLHGRARFLAPTVLAVDDHTRVEARAVVIATGSQPSIPPSLHGVRDAVLVNDDIFELRDLPRSMAVVGTGVVGLEIGQAMHRLGVRTVFFSHSQHLGPTTDPVDRETFGRSRVIDRRARAVERRGGDADVRVPICARVVRARGAVRFRARGDRPLARSGRPGSAADRPRAQCVGRAARRPAHHAVRRRADLHGRRRQQLSPVLHEASDEGEIAGANAAAYPDVRPHERRTRLEIAFTDPNMAIAARRGPSSTRRRPCSA
jgi:dihydrolipoamide dehydrogenase